MQKRDDAIALLKTTPGKRKRSSTVPCSSGGGDDEGELDEEGLRDRAVQQASGAGQAPGYPFAPTIWMKLLGEGESKAYYIMIRKLPGVVCSPTLKPDELTLEFTYIAPPKKEVAEAFGFDPEGFELGFRDHTFTHKFKFDPPVVCPSSLMGSIITSQDKHGAWLGWKLKVNMSKEEEEEFYF